MNRDCIWKSVEKPGFEHVMVREINGVIVANGIIVGINEKVPFRLHYVLRSDMAFKTKSVELSLIAPIKKWMSISIEEMGQWLVESGLPPEEVKACIDVDLSVSAFTNTVPIKRLHLQPGETKEMPVLHVSIPEFKLSIAKQRYTRKEDRQEKQVYLFENLTSNSTLEIVTDSEGIVTDYSTIFQRIW